MKANLIAVSVGLGVVVVVAAILLVAGPPAGSKTEIVTVWVEENPCFDQNKPAGPDNEEYICSVDKHRIELEGRAWIGACKGNTDACRVVWQLEKSAAGWTAEVNGKPAADQTPANQGNQIRKQFNKGNPIGGITPGAGPSVQPKRGGPYGSDGAYLWKYEGTVTNQAGKICSFDPEVCVRRPNSNGCAGAMAPAVPRKPVCEGATTTTTPSPTDTPTEAEQGADTGAGDPEPADS